MEALVSNPDHGETIVEEFNKKLVASQRLQLFFDDIVGKINELASPDAGTIDPSLFLQSSIIYKPSVGIEVVPAVINENEFVGRPLGGEIQGLDFVESWAILGNGSASIIINSPGASRNFTVESNVSPTMFQVLGSTNRIGISPSGVPASKGTVHIINSIAGGGVQGSITVAPDGDDLILEHDFFGGMSIHNGNNSTGSIYWGSPNWGGEAGQLWFLHDIDLGAIGAPSMGFDILGDTFISMFNDQFDGTFTGVFINPNQDSLIDFQINTLNASPFLRVDAANDRMGVSDINHAPTKGLIHIVQNAIAGTANPNSTADAIVIESDQNNGITFITPDSGISRINFGNHFNPSFASIHYDHNFTNVNQGFKFFLPTAECLQLLPAFGFDWNPNQVQTMDFRVRGFASSAAIFVDAQVNRTGFSNASLTPTDGLVHIQEGGSAGAVSSDNNADTIVLESNGPVGMSLLCPAANAGAIIFGSPVQNFRGIFQFSHVTDRFDFFVQGGTVFTIALLEVVVNETARTDLDFRVEGDTSTHLFFTDSSLDIVGISRTSLAPVHGALHIQEADAGVIAPLTTADLLVLEGTGEIGMSFLVDNLTGFANLNFGDPSNGADAGQIRYDANAAAWFFSSTGTEMMRFNPTLGIVINETGATVHDLRVESAGSNHMLFVDSGNNRIGIADNGFAPSDGLVHLFRGGAAGVVAASTLADGIVMESNAATGFSILVPNDGTACNLFMGAPTSGNAGGKLIYVPSLGLMTLETSALPAIRIDTDQNILLGTIGAAATSAAGALHIPNDTSPTAVLANAIVIGSKDSGAGGSLAVPELWIEEPPEVVGTFTPTMKFKVWINGVEYFIQLDPV